LPERHLAGVELVVALGMAAHAAGLSDHTIATAALFCAIALAGLAFTTERVTLLDTASVTCTATALVLSVGHRGVLPSLALLAAGSQAAAYGLARRQRLLTVTGGATMSAGLLSRPSVTGPCTSWRRWA
jgi:EamA domain-containing membrane protein RarD